MEAYGAASYQPMTETWTDENQDSTGYPNNLTFFEGSTGYPSSSSVAYPYFCAAIDFAFFSVIQGCFLIFGLFGNSLSMFVFSIQKPLTPTAFLLIFLGFYDNVVIIFFTLITGVSPICRLCNVCPYFLNTVYPNLVAMVWPFGTMGNMGGTMVVVCLTYHRFVGACYPHHVTKLANFRIARYQMAFTFAFVVIFNIPRFLDDYAYLPVNSSVMVTGWTALGNDRYFQLFYGGIVYYFLVFIVPFVLLIYMTYRLIDSLKSFHLKRGDHHANRTHSDENAVNKTLVIVVVAFMLAQVLNPIRRILATVLPEEETKCGYFYYYFYIISTLSITVEASIHFTLYCLFDRRFRRQLKLWIGSVPTAMVTPTQGGAQSIGITTGVRPSYSGWDPGIPQNR